MRAGTLNKIITIQELVETTGNYGNTEESFNNIKTTRASVNPVSGTETYIKPELLNRVSHKVEIRYDSNFNITPKHRLVFKGRIFDIESVLNMSERNEKLMILCTEKFEEVI